MIKPQEPYSPQLNMEDFVGNSKIIVKDYLCPLCKGVYLNPMIDNCGHIMCEKCINCYDPSLNKCPMTNAKLATSPKKVSIIVNIIEKQLLTCSNKGRGCKWEGQVKSYLSHIEKECTKQLVKCPKEECQAEVFREDYQSHLSICDYRSVNCKYCNIEIHFIQLESHHDICPKSIVECPNKCSITIERELLKQHIASDCDYSLIKCFYHLFGCKAKIIKKDMDQHKKSNHEYHLELIFQSILNNNNEVANQFNKIEEKLNCLTRIKGEEGAMNNAMPYTKSNYLNSIAISNDVSICFLGNKRARLEECNAVDKDKFNNKQTKGSVFDIVHLPKGIVYLENKAKCISTNHQHIFVYFKISHDMNPTVIHWKIKFVSAECWIASGMCDKEKVIVNDGKLYTKSLIKNHGAFLLSSNGYTWNTNVPEQNNKNLFCPFINSGDIVDFTFHPFQRELHIKHGIFNTVLTNITGNDLTGCIVFLHAKTEIEVILDQ